MCNKQMEVHMRAICEGRERKSDVVAQSLDQYREVFVITTQQMDVLRAVSSYLFLGLYLLLPFPYPGRRWRSCKVRDYEAYTSA
jgi:hypothetical protein